MGKREGTKKLTKRTVDALEAGEKEQLIFDSELPGFGVRVTPTGHKGYLIQYRNPPGRQGRTRRLALGRHGELTPEEARKIAREKLGEVARGGDPSGERHKRLRAPTVAACAERYMEEHSRPKKKASSVETDERLFRLYILPALGRRRVETLTPEDIGRLHHSLRGKPFQANRVLAVLSKMLNLAERWGLRPYGSNPCRHIERFREGKRKRYLSGEELSRLGKVLSEAEAAGDENPTAILAIRLLLFTGARKAEVLRLRWEEVDLEGRSLNLADSKTGEKTIPLNAPAVELLAKAPRREGNPYVCPGDKPGGHLVGLHRPWARLRARAGLEEVRLHDLRHTFASFGVAGGLGLPVIGGLLGHQQAATTQRYAHLAADPLHRAAEQIGGEIAAHVNGGGGDVVPFRRSKTT